MEMSYIVRLLYWVWRWISDVMRDVVRLKWSRMRVRFFSDANTSVVNSELTKRLSKSYSIESLPVS
jgi:hypothetical protein